MSNPKIQVWTPDSDPRSKKSSSDSIPVAKEPPVVQIRPSQSGPAVRIRVVPKSSAPAPMQAIKPVQESTVPKPAKPKAIEKPPVALEVVPVPEVARQPEPARGKSVDRGPRPPTKKQLLAAEHRLKIESLASEHQLHFEHARMVLAGEWTLERAISQHGVTMKSLPKKRKKKAKPPWTPMEREQLQSWSQSKVPLVQLQLHQEAQVLLRMRGLFDLCWWDNNAEKGYVWEEKLSTLALLSIEDAERWRPDWSREAMAADRIETKRKLRHVFDQAPLDYASEHGLDCTVRLLNGVSIRGFVVWQESFSLGLRRENSADAPFCLIFKHGIHSVLR